jgi:multicomponent Na+:H+ antiporter subunit E
MMVLKQLLPTAAGLLVLWLALVRGEFASLVVGVPAAFLGAAAFARRASRRTTPAYAIRWHYVPILLARFLGRSIVAGFDVARRVVSPRLDLAPALVTLPTALPEGAPRLFMAATLSLLPGTLSVVIDDDHVTVHLLDARHDPQDQLQQTEQLIAPLFGPARERA